MKMSDKVPVRLTVNGTSREGRCEPRKLLVDFLREDLGLTGTHVGCEHGICGACTIMLNGEAARSCIMLAVQADGAEIVTIEGLAQAGQLHPLQEERLRAQVRYAYTSSPFYRRKLDAAGIQPEQVKALADLERLPFTTKDELKQDQAEHPLWGTLLAVPFEQCLRVHMTSATTGRPLAFLDTREDWYGFYHSYARSLYAFGVRQADVVMAAFSYGPWIGYWSGFYAAQDLGALGGPPPPLGRGSIFTRGPGRGPPGGGARAGGGGGSPRASTAGRCRSSATARATSSSSATAAVPADGRWWPSRGACWRAWTT